MAASWQCRGPRPRRSRARPTTSSSEAAGADHTALIAVASLGTFAVLMRAMDDEQPSPDPTDVSVPTTTAPDVAAAGRSATTVLTVGDIGRLSASLHAGSAPASSSTTGP